MNSFQFLAKNFKISHMHVAVIIVLVCMGTVSYSCKKTTVENNATSSPISNTPRIDFKSITPQNIREFKDKIAITISYRDGDGDLGRKEADSPSVWIKDSRSGITETYTLQPLGPKGGEKVAIQGVLEINIPFTALIDSLQNSEKVKYSLYLKDATGNRSNTIETSEVIVER